MNRKAIIFGLRGYRLKKDEKLFLKKNKPWGIILFSRNIKSLPQLKNLIRDIKRIFNHTKYPILIDTEGGKISRLNKIIDLSIFSQNYFGKLYLNDKKIFLKYYKIYINAVSSVLKNVGVNINTVPVLMLGGKTPTELSGPGLFLKIQKKSHFLAIHVLIFIKKTR